MTSRNINCYGKNKCETSEYHEMLCVKRANTKYIHLFVLYKLFNSGCQLIDQLFLFKYFQSGSGERSFKGFKYFIL